MTAYVWLASLGILATGGQVITFNSGSVGKVPAGWTIPANQQGTAARWEIIKDVNSPTSNYVFAHTSIDPADGRFPLAVLNSVSLRDGDISVRIKPVAGREDQAGGLIWRYRDENNYYLVRADAVRKSVAVYKVVNGRCIPLVPRGLTIQSDGIQHDVPSRAWSILKVSARGSHFDIYMNHRRILRVADATFSRPGKVGLWTRAGSVTYFDDFRIYPR